MDPLRRVPQLWRYIAVALLSFAVSVTGVLLAVYKRTPSAGGRGGVIATALAFASLFLRPDYGWLIYKHRKSRIDPSSSRIDQLEQEIAALVSAFQINSKGQTHQNWAIAVASIIGTLFAGFGNVLAEWLM